MLLYASNLLLNNYNLQKLTATIIYLVVHKSFSYVHMGQGIQEWTKQNLWKTAFKKLEVIWSGFKFFKGCLPQILLSRFLNTLTHIIYITVATLFCFILSSLLFFSILISLISKSFSVASHAEGHWIFESILSRWRRFQRICIFPS